ncbi:Myeloid differentiation primary response protein MyD88 [Pseudolycoriella hygida]|uniref:Myeloid differentiation primary response protein MyD88 n=1 Tax=Pseudolycoriella hygida TaxID=35572 RepID=A0A9Q0N1G1_9DIPT|nr:Myeloid differentiation primary response protein MyD88 [Pseudolycoriella hygida]
MVDTTVDLQQIPLSALKSKSRNSLSIYLDAIKILPSTDGLSRDWRGIYQLSGLPNHYESFLSSKLSPTLELIKILEKEPHDVTFSDFRKMLGDIDRWDVVDDTYELFVDDAVEYLKKKDKYERSQQQIVDPMSREIIPSQDCLTLDDVLLSAKKLPPQRYDAFILFADNDIDFATEMIEKVEGFGFKLCVKERDFLAGLTFEHDAIRHLLTERCDRLVVILSPDFICSPLNEYISNLAQSLGIAQRKRKIIPCLYKSCELPEIFKHIHLLNYERSKMFYNFWDKLKVSLQTTPEERIANECPRITVTDTDQKTVAPVISVPKDVKEVPSRQRKRNAFKNQQSIDLESLPTPPSSPPISTDPNRKFWPPSPKLRSTRSMINLTDLDSAETNNNGSEQRSKKPKWYNKLSHTLKITPQNLKLSGSDSNLNKEKTKNVRMVDTTTVEIPLSALKPQSRIALSIYLDVTSILPSNNGLWRDWRGLHQLSGLPKFYKSYLSKQESPTIELIKILESESSSVTFAQFRKMLGDIDRWDVVDETFQLFVDDAVEYLKEKENYERSQQQIVNTKSQEEVPSQTCLTLADVALSEKNLPPERYDALVLFADSVSEFAMEIIEKVEGFGFKLCVKERDFLGGLNFEHDAIRRLLTERCERLVVILSPDFMCNPLNEYVSILAQSIGIEQRKPKIIPCVYKSFELPQIFRHINPINYEKSKMFHNFWDKLKISLQATS